MRDAARWLRILFLASSESIAFACGEPAAPEAEVAPTAGALSAPAEPSAPVEPGDVAVAGAADSNERDLHVVVHLPGADPSRWLVADFSGCARPATLSGCVVSSPTEACGVAGGASVRLTDAEAARLGGAAAGATLPDSCDAPPPSDRAYRVESWRGTTIGWLPPGPEPWPEGVGACGVPWAVSTAIAHLVPR